MIIYTVEDWSVNPCHKRGLTLREVIDECQCLEDEEIRRVATMMIDDVFEGSEFSITCTGKSA